MLTRHNVDFLGNRFTDCHYEIDGVPAMARLHGHLSVHQAEHMLTSYRSQAAKVAYFTMGHDGNRIPDARPRVVT